MDPFQEAPPKPSPNLPTSHYVLGLAGAQDDMVSWLNRCDSFPSMPFASNVASAITKSIQHPEVTVVFAKQKISSYTVKPNRSAESKHLDSCIYVSNKMNATSRRRVQVCETPLVYVKSQCWFCVL